MHILTPPVVERMRPINLVPTEEPTVAAMVVGAWLDEEARGKVSILLRLVLVVCWIEALVI